MPGRPSCLELQKQLLACRQVIQELSTDPVWNVTTYAAIPFAMRDVKGAAYVVYATTPHDPAFAFVPPPGSIRRAIHTRSAHCLLRARWNNDNDVVFILSAHPLQFCEQLGTAMRNEGIVAVIGWSTFTGNLTRDVDDCKRNSNLSYTLPKKEGKNE